MNSSRFGLDFWKRLGLVAGYSLPIAWVVFFHLAHYRPDLGVTFLVRFGDFFAPRHLEPLQEVNFFLHPNSPGYDGQMYAQLALSPLLTDPGLVEALDNPAYRARRILFSWTAWVLGLGRPELIIHAFSWQNTIFWVANGVLLFHWLPFGTWFSLARWTGIQLGWGMATSLHAALIDGPSLFLLALGIYLLERKRHVLGSLLLGLNVLAKETNLLSGVVFLRRFFPSREEWPTLLMKGALLAGPFVLWLIWIHWTWGLPQNSGNRNFSWPFVDFWQYFKDPWMDLWQNGYRQSRLINGLTIFCLAVHFLYLCLHPRWSSLWWRVGFSFGLLMVVLGGAVWEGFPGAAARVVLPMSVAFQLLLVAGVRGWLWWILGNLSLVGTVFGLWPHWPEFSPQVKGPAHYLSQDLRYPRLMEMIQFEGAWSAPELIRGRPRMWAMGPASLHIHHHGTEIVEAELSFRSRGMVETLLHVSVSNGTIENTEFTLSTNLQNYLLPLRLYPGTNVINFVTEEPPVRPSERDSRLLSFSLVQPLLRVKGIGEAATGADEQH